MSTSSEDSVTAILLIAVPIIFGLYVGYLSWQWLLLFRRHRSGSAGSSFQWENTFFILIILCSLGRVVLWSIYFQEHGDIEAYGLALPMLAQACSIGFILGSLILVFFWAEKFADIRLAFAGASVMDGGWTVKFAFHARLFYFVAFWMLFGLYAVVILALIGAKIDVAVTYMVGQGILAFYSFCSAVIFLTAGYVLLREVSKVSIAMTFVRKREMSNISYAAKVNASAEVFRFVILIVFTYVVPNDTFWVILVSFIMYCFSEILPTLMLLNVLTSTKGPSKGLPKGAPLLTNDSLSQDYSAQSGLLHASIQYAEPRPSALAGF